MDTIPASALPVLLALLKTKKPFRSLKALQELRPSDDVYSSMDIQTRVYKRCLKLLNKAVVALGEEAKRQLIHQANEESDGRVENAIEGPSPLEVTDTLSEAILQECGLLQAENSALPEAVKGGGLFLMAQTAGYSLAACLGALSHSVSYSAEVMSELARRFVCGEGEEAGESDGEESARSNQEGRSSGGGNSKSAASRKLTLSQRFQCWQDRVAFLLEVGVGLVQGWDKKLQRALVLFHSTAASTSPSAALSRNATSSGAGQHAMAVEAFKRLLLTSSSSPSSSAIIPSSAPSSAFGVGGGTGGLNPFLLAQKQRAATRLACLAFFQGIGVVSLPPASASSSSAAAASTSSSFSAPSSGDATNSGLLLLESLEAALLLRFPTLVPMWPRLVTLLDDLRTSLVAMAVAAGAGAGASA